MLIITHYGNRNESNSPAGVTFANDGVKPVRIETGTAVELPVLIENPVVRKIEVFVFNFLTARILVA